MRTKPAIFATLTTAVIATATLIAIPVGAANAHGYISTPGGVVARVAIGNSGIGPAQWDRQSLEAKGDFPASGPADGHIASADGAFGTQLDEQSSTRWIKTVVGRGALTIDWTYTAKHRTSGWKYYLTKPGWDQNAPLRRDELELINSVGHDGTPPGAQSQSVVIPMNRLGYHVLVGVWNIADTDRAFYNVVDLEVSPDAQKAHFAQIPAGQTGVGAAASAAAAPATGSTSAASAAQGSAHGSVQGAGASHGTGTATSSSGDLSAQSSQQAAARAEAEHSAHTLAQHAMTPEGGHTLSSGFSAESIAPFDPTRSYRAGELVAYGNMLFRAQLPNQGFVPSSLIWLPLTSPTETQTAGTTSVTPSATSTPTSTPTTSSPAPSSRATASTPAPGTDSQLRAEHSSTHSLAADAADPQPNTSARAGADQNSPTPSTSQAPQHRAPRAAEPGTAAGTKPASDNVPAPWSPTAAYSTDAVVSYGGAQYRAMQPYQGWGDWNWINAPSLWTRIG